ncbi:MAG TPA: SPOR domain-containing protein [Terriglobales bacterium]|nr:SPOR domain-containing protein [Terriglobales bacterium]
MPEGQDTEITLGTGRLLGLFFGLVVVCAAFFGLGFSMGRNSVKNAALTLQENPVPTSAANGPFVKTSPGTPDRATGTTSGQSTAPAITPAASQPSTTVVVTPAPTASAPAQASVPPEMTKTPNLSGGNGYTVQIAAVSKEEDAEALVDALKKKSYPVFVASAPSDKLFHVQVGPFADVKDAEAMKAKLMGDGYNPIVKR